MKSRGSGTVTAIAAVAGLAALGIGGYRLTTGHCPLTGCALDSKGAVAVHAVSAPGSGPVGVGGCCPKSEAAPENCEVKAAECETMAHCDAKAAECEGKSACDVPCEAAEAPDSPGEH